VPEGDTIARAARTLNSALAGQVITRFETVLPQLARVDDQAPLAGRTVERVVSEGKNLVIDFSGDLHLRTHMRMNGSWHIYRPGERWRKQRADMRIVLETAGWVAVAFNVPVAELHDGRSLERQEDLLRIGPDFAAAEFDMDEALRRIRERGTTDIADVLLNQRVVAGIGNEFKSEVLFISRVNPFTPVAALSDEQLLRILQHMRKLMLANVNKPAAGRVTNFSLDRSQAQYVYGRGRKPCRRCGTPIQHAKHWCPKCQPG
jgi:endonuclease-8